VPFFAALPLAFLFSALIGFILERTLYVHVYRKPHLDQVLFTIGLVFMSVAAVDYVMGSSQVFVQLPSWLQGQDMSSVSALGAIGCSSSSSAAC
jgi:branched-chain amino acid transport system permease protein